MNADRQWPMFLRLTSPFIVALSQLVACKDSHRPVPLRPPPSGAPSAAPEVLLFPQQRVTYAPLPGWANRRAELAALFVDGDAGARLTKTAEGEVFHLDAPRGSGFIAVNLLSLPMPDAKDPVALLEGIVDADRAAYAKQPHHYVLTVPPRELRNEQGIRGAEMATRWDRWGDGKWQRTAYRVFVRHGRAYLLDCGWDDRLGETPAELASVLDALHFQ